MNNAQFEVFKRTTLFGKRWFFRFRGANGEVMLQSQGYTRMANAEHTIAVLQRVVPVAEVVYL